MTIEFPIVGEYRRCDHGYEHPPWTHSCDGCWCDDARDMAYNWPPGELLPRPARGATDA